MKPATKAQLLELMEFPRAWLSEDMYPDELFDLQRSEYEPGHEDAPEHYRCGAFHWWLRRSPSKQQLLSLAKLAVQDPDTQMAGDVGGYIARAENSDAEVRRALGKLTGSLDRE